VGGPLLFRSGGYPLDRKEGPPPRVIGRQNIPSDDNSTRSTGFENAGKGGVGPHLCPDRGVGVLCFKKIGRGVGGLSFLGAGGATQGLPGGGIPNGPGIASASPIKKF